MNKITLVSNRALQFFNLTSNSLCFVKAKFTNRLTLLTYAISIALFTFSGKTAASCTPPVASGVTTNCDNLSVQTTKLGTGPGLNDVTINVLPDAVIDTSVTSAISLDSNANITIDDNASVRNTTTAASGAGDWGAGENTIQFASNSTLTVMPGARITAQGTIPAFKGSAILINGSGNHIINHGSISSLGSSTITIHGGAGTNIIDNYGSLSTVAGLAIEARTTPSTINLINHRGGSIIGNIYFGNGDDTLTLEVGSSFTSTTGEGQVNGSGGTDTLLLTGDGTLDQLDIGIYNFERIIKDGTGDWDLSFHTLTGTGVINTLIVNNGILSLNFSVPFTGVTTINGGTLIAATANVLSPNSTFTIAPAGTLNLMGFNQTIAAITNAGTIDINPIIAPGSPTATVLTVTGDYIGHDGLINFNAHLSDDDSDSERLIIQGDTSGTTRVAVNNAGGSGAATLNGIKLISVDGASDGEFAQQGRIVAGAYDYFLARGTGTDADNWYLTSSLSAADPVPDPTPDPDDMIERPEDAVYGANLAVANSLFSSSRAARSQMTAYIDPTTGEQKTTSLWMINQGGHNRARDDSGQLRTQTNRYVLQLGGDIGRWSSNGQDSFRLGVMGGYGNAKSSTNSSVSGYRANGSVDGYSVGVYGTWYENATDRSGLYVDGWTQYGWFDNTVEGQDLANEDYKSKGFSAGLESGYAFKLAENAAQNTAYFIQPQAQAIWMNVKADDLTESNGTRVRGEGDGNIQTRLGVKAFMQTYGSRDKENNRVFEPFVEANWIHNSDEFGATLDGVTIKQSGADNIGELKLGVAGQISKNVNLWGNVAQQVGNKGYSDTGGMVGIKYLF